jgi:hypothetical protein
MKPQTFRSFPRLLPLAALLMAGGLAQAIEPPRVMFVSGIDLQPVLIDLQGKEIPAKKGQVIPPGYSVKVPEGATVQIMTDEKAIVAVRQNSLLKLEKLGDGGEPHKFKLDLGGLRIANHEKKAHRFEVDTPNAKIKFDKGDHETFYLKEGNKFTGEKWGTFVRGFKDESVLSTKDGDTRISRTVVGYVPGMSKDGKTELISRINVGGNLSDPVGAVFGGGGIGQAVTDLNENQRVLSDNAKPAASDPKTVPPAPVQKGALAAAPVLVSSFTAPKEIVLPPKTILPPITPIAGLEQKLAIPDMKTVANLSMVKPVSLEPAIKPELSLQKDLTTGLSVPVLKESTSISVLAITPQTTVKVPITTTTTTSTKLNVCLTCTKR